MEKPSLELVLQALDTFNRHQNPSEQEKASKWLMQLQASVHAWEVADQLLLLKRDRETSYFAAQTMQSKVRFSFDELPPDTHISLRDSLLNHLQNFSTAHSAITRQLALALADLALQMTQWTSIVPDLIQRFGNDVSTVSVLLDILIVLPEEINNRSLHLGHIHRKELRELLGNSCTAVLSLLLACLSSCGGDDLLTKVYAAVSSWVQLGNFPIEEFSQSSLIQAPFHTLSLLTVPQILYEAATDCICSLLYVCEDVTRYYSLATVLKAQVKQLLPLYQAAVQTEDSDRASSICRIFTELCESFLYHLTRQPFTEMGDLDMLEWLLGCMSHPEYETVEISFNVWYRISEELLKIDSEETTALFRPFISRLISQLCLHCQLDEDTSTTSIPDEKDEFSDFRDNVTELLRDVTFIVGSISCFGELYNIICKPGLPWNETEACLFVMHAIAPSIRADESRLLPIAIPVLLSIPPDTHYAVRAMTLKLIGELAEWIDNHHDVLDLVLQFILNGLKIPIIATYAAKAVQKVCQKCRDRMAPHFSGLLAIIQSADQLSVSGDAIVGLLKGAAEVLSQMPTEQVTDGVRQLCQLQTTPLIQLTQGSHVVRAGTSTDPAIWMDRLTAIFRSCSVQPSNGLPHPCQPVVDELWPVLAAVVTKYQSDTKIMERSCRCIRFIIRCLGKSAASILSPLVTLSVQTYQAHHHSCFIYLGSVIVDEFGSDPNYQQGLLGMLQAYAETCFPLLGGPNGLIEHPDTVDDIFRLCGRFLQRAPLPFLSSPVAPTIIQCSLAAATHQHRDAFTSVMKFFRDFIQLPLGEEIDDTEKQLRQAAVQSFLAHSGQLLMNGLVTGFVCLPTFMLVESTEVLWAVMEFAREPTLVLLKLSIERLPVPKSVTVTSDQHSSILCLISECQTQEELYPIIKDLARLYR